MPNFKHGLKFNRRSAKVGLPSGSLVRVGRIGDPIATQIEAITYDPEELTHVEPASVDAISDLKKPDHVLWVNVNGLDDIKVVESVGKQFGLHPLLLEDVLNTDHRPKIEEFPDHLFVVAKMLRLDPVTGQTQHEQVSLILGEHELITFQERKGDVFDPVRDRLRKNLGRLRKSGADHLLYALLDILVDNYFSVIEELGQRIMNLEERVVRQAKEDHLREILQLRNELLELNRIIVPTKELLGRALSIPAGLIKIQTRQFLIDIQDHSVHAAESITVFRETLAGLENTYHAMVNLHMGKVVKLLTIISTIFIPLTFIAGIYGMNFEHMPELHSQNGYYITLGIMGGIAVVMLLLLRWKKWL